MKPEYLLAIAMLCIGCGGSSSSSSSHIQGTWSGNKIYGGASCADGTFISAGSGSSVGTLTLIVEGGDEIGSQVTASEESCVMHGERTSTGFTADTISGCTPELNGVTFTLTNNDTATISYRGDLKKIPVRANTPQCLAAISVSATR